MALPGGQSTWERSALAPLHTEAATGLRQPFLLSLGREVIDIDIYRLVPAHLLVLRDATESFVIIERTVDADDLEIENYQSYFIKSRSAGC